MNARLTIDAKGPWRRPNRGEESARAAGATGDATFVSEAPIDRPAERIVPPRAS
jgi:hypothetical protein